MTKVKKNWLFFLYQVPSKPEYVRVKVWRQLQKTGAVHLKNSIYVLPDSLNARASFDAVLSTAQNDGGDGAICEARLITGVDDSQLEALFNEARDSDYQKLANEARMKLKLFDRKKGVGNDEVRQLLTSLKKLEKEFEAIQAIDFFVAPQRETTQGILQELANRCHLQSPGAAAIQGEAIPLKELKSRIWVTRRGVHIDRMACAWLIRSFIDDNADFKFVEPQGYRPRAGELRFDMSDAEFTHEGNDCSFEVLIRRLNLKDPALKELSEIIHDIDIRDAKFRRQEAVGVERIINGIVGGHKSDMDRIERASIIFDDLYGYFKSRR